jgi:hypothetical protein
LIARTLDQPPVMIADQIVKRAAVRMKELRLSDEYGLLDWQALLRLLDRSGVEYRH